MQADGNKYPFISMLSIYPCHVTILELITSRLVESTNY